MRGATARLRRADQLRPRVRAAAGESDDDIFSTTIQPPCSSLLKMHRFVQSQDSGSGFVEWLSDGGEAFADKEPQPALDGSGDIRSGWPAVLPHPHPRL